MSKASKLLKMINESSDNGSVKLLRKYFTKSCADDILVNGEDDHEFISDYYSAEHIAKFDKILNSVTSGGKLRYGEPVEDDSGYSGPAFGTEFTIDGLHGNYISGYHQPGKIAFGVGSPSNSAILTLYKTK